MLTINKNGKDFFNQPYVIQFGWVNKIKDQFVLAQRPYSCKDYMTDCMYLPQHPTVLYYPTTVPVNHAGNPVKINKNALMMYINVPTKYLENIPAAIKLVNSFEKKARFKLTTIEQAEVDNAGINTNHFLVQGSKLWMRNTVLVSIYISLLRLAIYTGKDTVEDCIKVFSTQAFSGFNDWYQLGCTEYSRKRFINAVNNIRALIKKAPNTYDPDTGHKNATNNSHGTVGIFHLTSQNVRCNNFYKSILDKLYYDPRTAT